MEPICLLCLLCFAMLCFVEPICLLCLLCFAMLCYAMVCYENRASGGRGPAKLPSVSADSWCVGEIGQRLDFRFPAEGNGAPGAAAARKLVRIGPFRPTRRGGLVPGTRRDPPPPLAPFPL